MLVLSRKPGESIVIDGRIVVKILRVEGETVKLGIDAPAAVTVHRHEVQLEIQQNNHGAAAKSGLALPRLILPAPPAKPPSAGGQDSPPATP